MAQSRYRKINRRKHMYLAETPIISSSYSELQELSEDINMRFTILFLIIILIPIQWLPNIHPRTLQNIDKILMALFILLQIGYIINDRTFELPWPKLIFSSVLIGLGIFIHGYFTRALIIAFGCVTVFYFHQNKKNSALIFQIFTIWITILTVYSLLITFSPLSGFELASKLHTGYINPVERFPHPFIEINSFGFFGVRGVYTITSIALIFSSIYAYQFNSKFYYFSTLSLSIQLGTIYWLTGEGRAGFVLPTFLIIIAVIKKYSIESVIPIVVFSPLVTWVSLYTLKDFPAIWPLLEALNDFMSNRLALYFDAITILLNNPQSIIGWGPSPWGEYSHVELGVYSSIGSYGDFLTRPHNFLFEMLIQYGILIGIILIYTCFRIARVAIRKISAPNSSTQFGLGVMLSGTIFAGMAFGAKMGPYPVNDPDMILWWIGFGAFISDV